jgi:hypothetical protein
MATIRSTAVKHVAVAAGCAGLGRIESKAYLETDSKVIPVYTIGQVGGTEV